MKIGHYATRIMLRKYHKRRNLRKRSLRFCDNEKSSGREILDRINMARERAYESSLLRAQHLPLWLHHYNWHRPHAGLQYQPPISRIPELNNLVGLHG